MDLNRFLQDRVLTTRNFDEQRRLAGDFESELSVILEAESKKLNLVLDRHSFRSNLAKISVLQRNKGASILLWDERYFDLIFDVVKKAVFVKDEKISKELINSHIADFYGNGGIYWIVNNPFLALVLQGISYKLRSELQAPTAEINSIQKCHAVHIFRIIKTFCLLHEIGHLAESDMLEKQFLSFNVDRLQDTYSNELFQNIYSQEERSHIERVAKYMDNGNTKRELRADIYALKKLFEYEKIYIEDNCAFETWDEVKTIHSLLINEAMILFHHAQADFDLIKRFTAKSSSSINILGDEQQMLLARGDARIYLATIFAPEIFSDSEKGMLLMYDNLGTAVPRYSNTYKIITLNAVEIIKRHDTNIIFSYESKLRGQQSYDRARKQAIRNIGWDS